MWPLHARHFLGVWERVGEGNRPGTNILVGRDKQVMTRGENKAGPRHREGQEWLRYGGKEMPLWRSDTGAEFELNEIEGGSQAVIWGRGESLWTSQIRMCCAIVGRRLIAPKTRKLGEAGTLRGDRWEARSSKGGSWSAVWSDRSKCEK